MDYVKLYQYYQSSKLTDVELTLNDRINILQLKVHKLILSLSAPFFEKQFAFSTEDKIILTVDNVFVAYDLIMSFYNQQINYGKLEHWFHQLKTFQLRDYFGLENDATLLFDLKVPVEGFDLLLQVCELIGFDEDILKTIIKNLPNDYDCFKLSKDLLNEMIKLESYCKIISGGSDKTQIWNSKTGELINTFMDNVGRIETIAISSDNKLIASGGNCNIIIWNAQTSKLITKLLFDGIVLCVAFSPNNELIISGNYNHIIKVWNIQNGVLICNLFGHNDTVRSVVFSPDNKYIVSGSDDSTIKVWNATNYQLLNTINFHTNRIWSVSISSDSTRIVSGSSDHTIKICNIENGALIASCEVDDSIYYVQFSSNNNKIIAASSNHTIKILNTINYQLIQTIKGHKRYVNSVQFSPDNKFIISGSADCCIKIWDADNYQLINTIDTGNCVNCLVIYNTCDSELSKKLKKYI